VNYTPGFSLTLIYIIPFCIMIIVDAENTRNGGGSIAPLMTMRHGS